MLHVQTINTIFITMAMVSPERAVRYELNDIGHKTFWHVSKRKSKGVSTYSVSGSWCNCQDVIYHLGYPYDDKSKSLLWKRPFLQTYDRLGIIYKHWVYVWNINFLLSNWVILYLLHLWSLLEVRWPGCLRAAAHSDILVLCSCFSATSSHHRGQQRAFYGAFQFPVKGVYDGHEN